MKIAVSTAYGNFTCFLLCICCYALFARFSRFRQQTWHQTVHFPYDSKVVDGGSLITTLPRPSLQITSLHQRSELAALDRRWRRHNARMPHRQKRLNDCSHWAHVGAVILMQHFQRCAVTNQLLNWSHAIGQNPNLANRPKHNNKHPTILSILATQNSTNINQLHMYEPLIHVYMLQSFRIISVIV